MRKIALFCEDSGHEAVIKALIIKLAPKGSVQVMPLSARQGKGRALAELEKYLKNVERGQTYSPDAIVAAIDANCKGHNDKRSEIDAKIPDKLRHIPFVHAVPDPHVERWLLIDSQAFKQVFGKGCDAPDQKCEKDRYKFLLREAVRKAGGTPLLGGMEHAEEIIKHMDMLNIKKLDDSLKRFMEELEAVFKGWEL
ncbi:MAG: DUF4276 family protein [Nitrospinae bacterium]|nr:DUF4276 family protein [Nitrospinota bacterium]